MVDLKRVMVDYFLKQGIAVQENSITDEMLFSNLATNAALRQTGLTSNMRARGYALRCGRFYESTESASPTRRAGVEEAATGKDENLEEDNVNRGTGQLARRLYEIFHTDGELLPQSLPFV